uniref:Peptidase S1 domain-containing protein n=1 Tax=Heliothis virescens TaxID=7102 RepID=A0A2A4J0W0_HELVI
MVMCEYDRRVITTLKYSKYSVTPTVVNGKPASASQFPFLVSFKEPIKRMEPGKLVWKNLCGGSIIGRHEILTAAHCFESNNFYFARYPKVLRAVAGEKSTDVIHSGVTETTPEAQWRQLINVRIHPSFSFPSNDIAIAHVDQPWVYTKNVNVIKIAKSTNDYAHQCVSAGYGRVGHRLRDAISPVLLAAPITTMPRWRCSLVWEMNMNSFICTDSAITDVARGDSGGPLLCQHTGDPNEKNDEGILVGVVSGKNFDKTTLYTRVSEFNKWIATGAGDSLRNSVDVCLVIILVVLIYLLFCLMVSWG